MVLLFDTAGSEGKVVGRAVNVPYMGRLFEYRHPRAGRLQVPTRFRWINKEQAVYASGYKFWEDTP